MEIEPENTVYARSVVGILQVNSNLPLNFMFLSILLHSGLWLRKRNPNTIMASWAFPEAVAASWLSRLYNTNFFFKVHGSDINLHGKFLARAKQILSAANIFIIIIYILL